MNIEVRPASESDADFMSELALSFAEQFIVDASEASRFLDALSPMAFRIRLASCDFAYYVATEDHTAQGYLGLFLPAHVYHLFVLPSAQRRGVARRLWEQALKHHAAPDMTVNASINAVPVYLRFGFTAEGELKVKQGVQYQPMRRRALS